MIERIKNRMANRRKVILKIRSSLIKTKRSNSLKVLIRKGGNAIPIKNAIKLKYSNTILNFSMLYFSSIKESITASKNKKVSGKKYCLNENFAISLLF